MKNHSSKNRWESYWRNEDEHAWWSRPALEVLEFIATQSPEQRPKVLDLGCGQGWYACEMARLGHQMVAVDLSKKQIRQARDLAQEERVDTRFATASATRLPFLDDCFDFAYAVNMVHHVLPRKEQRELFAEVVRVLKPGFQT